MTTLSINELSKRYKHDRWALHEVSLRMENGVLGLVGPNGSGKTTLLKILATLLFPTSGNITWDGRDILRHPEVLRQVLGYVPQDFGVYPQLTARHFLCYIGELKGLYGPRLQSRVEAVLEMVNLHAEAHVPLKAFSGGMVRRIGIAQALLNDPLFLVLDEPTVGLDPAERARFREMLAALRSGHMVIFSTHIMSDIESTATHLALLNRGRLIWTGTPEDLLADSAEAIWGVTVSEDEFSTLRTRCHVSNAIPRSGTIELRIIASSRPHPEARLVTPTLEEAYLFFQDEYAQTPVEAGKALRR